MKYKKEIILAILAVFISIVLYFAYNPNNSPLWTGFGNYNKNNEIERYKTLWDWLELIVTPVAIGLSTWLYSEFEKEKIKKIEIDKSREKIIESFISNLSELMLNYENSISSEQKRLSIARARINLALPQLDSERKGQLLQFIYELKLIKIKPKINLIGCDFNFANLDNIVLQDTSIKGAHFKNSKFNNTYIKNADFTSCDFENTSFYNSIIENVKFNYTNLANTKFENIDLTSIDFEGADLANAYLKGCTIKQDQLDGILKKTNLKKDNTKII